MFGFLIPLLTLLFVLTARSGRDGQIVKTVTPAVVMIFLLASGGESGKLDSIQIFC